MATGGSNRVIVLAFVGNFLIAISKFVAAAITGASSMFAEGVHSLVDSGNQLLLLFGLKRSRRPADAKHPFGYGMEVYFWSFVVAILLFSIGAGVSIYEGIEKARHPHPVASPHVNYIVLCLAVVFEGYAWHAAYKEINARRGKMGILQYVRRSKDAPLFVVLFEDSAALLGIFVALLGLVGAQVLDMPVLDGYASVAIGCLLALAAVLLAIETKGLLIGEAADPQIVETINEIVSEDEKVLTVNEVLTMHLGPDDILVTLSVDFHDDYSSRDVERSISQIERKTKDRFPQVRRLFIEAQSADQHAAEIARSRARDQERAGR